MWLGFNDRPYYNPTTNALPDAILAPQMKAAAQDVKHGLPQNAGGSIPTRWLLLSPTVRSESVVPIKQYTALEAKLRERYLTQKGKA